MADLDMSLSARVDRMRAKARYIPCWAAAFTPDAIKTMGEEIDRLRAALARVEGERDDWMQRAAKGAESFNAALADCRVLAECFDGMNGADLSAKYGAGRSLRIKDAIARHAKGGAK